MIVLHTHFKKNEKSITFRQDKTYWFKPYIHSTVCGKRLSRHPKNRYFLRPTGFSECMRLWLFFHAVVNPILHFVNCFPHCYRYTQCRTGIFLWTVADKIIRMPAFFPNTRELKSKIFSKTKRRKIPQLQHGNIMYGFFNTERKIRFPKNVKG